MQNILIAFSNYYTEICYYQGIKFIVSFFYIKIMLLFGYLLQLLNNMINLKDLLFKLLRT